ncbi:hypothetical protein JRQ81_008429, partial [Phrynocephalus forsythii]
MAAEKTWLLYTERNTPVFIGSLAGIEITLPSVPGYLAPPAFMPPPMFPTGPYWAPPYPLPPPPSDLRFYEGGRSRDHCSDPPRKSTHKSKHLQPPLSSDSEHSVPSSDSEDDNADADDDRDPQYLDHLFDQISSDSSSLAHLGILPSILDMAKDSLKKIPSSSKSRRIESLYRVFDEAAPFLAKHPSPNSLVISASQMNSKSKVLTVPPSKEGRKVDSMARQLYSSAALSFKITNYQAAMGAYQRALLNKLQLLLEALPDTSTATAQPLMDEAFALAAQQMCSGRHASNSATKSLGFAIAFRRHAWLRSTGLGDNTKSKIECLPFEGEGLFHEKTDELMNDMHKSQNTAKCFNVIPQKPFWPFRSSWRKSYSQSFSKQQRDNSFAAQQPPPLAQNYHRQGGGHDSPSRHSPSPTDGLEDSTLIFSIYVAARKPSTRKSYSSKWRRFLHYTSSHSYPHENPPLQVVLLFLLHLKKSGLSMSSLRVFLSAIVAHQPLDSPAATFFRHPHLKLFLRDLKNTFPDRRPFPPQWSLSLVLRALSGPPFEPLVKGLQYLSSTPLQLDSLDYQVLLRALPQAPTFS